LIGLKLRMKNNSKLTLKIYWRYVREFKLLIFVTFVCAAGGSAMAAIIPLYFKKFFDLFSNQVGTKDAVGATLISVLWGIGFVELLRWIFWRLAAFTNNRFQPLVIAKLSEHCFQYLHRHSFSYFNNTFVGSLVKKVNWFTRAFENIADKVTWSLLPLLVELTIIVVVLSRKSLWLGGAILVWLLIFLAINWLLTQYKLRYDIKRNEAETNVTGILADTITNNNNVKLFRGYEREVASFSEATEKVRKLRQFTWNLDTIFDGVQGFLVTALEIGIFYLAINLWKKGAVTIGDFVLLQSYLLIIFEKIWDFGKLIRRLYADLADAEEMTVILNTPHEIRDIPGAKKLKVNQGKIEFREVRFNYHETRKVIQQLDFTIQPKEKIALVGPSGAGKTTVIKLLLRMHDVTEGKILIDDQNIAKITQESLWESLSLVPQDPILFHRSLMDNIRYGKANATDEEVMSAAKLAHCHEFIGEFPEKYQTFVGERGIKLSGGERQRVAVARAILRNAPILILDEATSSLDSESEHLIQDALSSLMRDKTVIVIAHRLSTIMKMDRIIVMDHGEIIEEGSHQTLLEKTQGTYQQLWKLQAGGFMPQTLEKQK